MHWELKVKVAAASLSDVLEKLENIHGVDWEILRSIKLANLEPRSSWIQPKKLPKAYALPARHTVKSMADKVGDLIKGMGADAPPITKPKLISLIKSIGGQPSGISYYVGNLRASKVLGKYNPKTGAYSIGERG